MDFSHKIQAAEAQSNHERDVPSARPQVGEYRARLLVVTNVAQQQSMLYSVLEHANHTFIPQNVEATFSSFSAKVSAS